MGPLIIAISFKESIIEMMQEIAKAISDTHKQTPLKAYFTGGGAVYYQRFPIVIQSI